MPVLGSGHPQADIFLLKYAPVPSEIEEGVAFYGRAGSALMKSFKRLGVDPLAVYGTVFVKCPVADTEMSAPECRARVLGELAIVQPRIVVVMGEAGLLELNDLDVPMSRPLEMVPGQVQRLTPSIEALWCPDIDASLDDEVAKRAFWSAFHAPGAGIQVVEDGSSEPRGTSRRRAGHAHRDQAEGLMADLEESGGVEPVIQQQCAECGAKLTEAEIRAALDSGGPYLCSVHA